MDLIVAATAEELGDLPVRLAGRLVGTFIAGIGLVDATAALAERLAVSRGGIRRVIFIGTAGAYPDSGLSVGDTVAVESVELLDGFTGEAYLPTPMVSSLDTAFVLPGVPSVVATSRAGISRSVPPPRDRPTVESMEAFAVVRAATLAGVAAGSLLAISNRVGPDAHEDWKRHGAEAMESLRVTLLAAL
jgi:purine-nucleoside phosphorylase